MGYLISIILQVMLQIPAVRITAVTVLPSILLLRYVRKKDTLEKEPPRLIWSLFGLGALSTAIAFVLELGSLAALNAIAKEGSGLYTFLHWYVAVGLVEELSKYLILYLRTWQSREFNCLFDGLVYAVAISAGFALAENIVYLIKYGASIMLFRAVVSIPAHICFSVFMGSFYGATMKYSFAGDELKAALCHVLSILIPALAHGLFDHLATIVSDAAGMLPFLGYTAVMFIVCWILIRRLSAKDRYFNGQDEDSSFTPAP